MSRIKNSRAKGITNFINGARKAHLASTTANPKEDPKAPDMILFAKEGYIFGDTASGDLPFKAKPERKDSRSHDSAIPHLHAVFVAWGEGIKAGAKLVEIQNTAVAPTVAKLLGFSIPNAEGRALDQILKD